MAAGRRSRTGRTGRGLIGGMDLGEALAAQEDRLLTCVHCGFCLPVCPTYTRLGDEADSPRGRLYLMRALVEGRLDAGSDAFQEHIDMCVGCRACETVCPSGVEYGFLLERAREAAAEAKPPRLPPRLLLAVFRRPSLLGAALALARILRASGLPGLARLLPGRPPSLGRVRHALAMLAATSGGEGEGAGEAAAAPGAPLPGADGRSRRVALLRGCVQEGLLGRVNRATARVLEANGCEVVDAPEQSCCGALHAHAGALRGAREMARRNVAAFEDAGVDHVAVNAAGCGAVMKEWGELLADDPEWAERARLLAEKVVDVAELLVEVGPREGGAIRRRVTYDAACHLHHGQRVQEEPLRLLASIPELELVPLSDADECCGGAGIYGMNHPEMGGRILDDKLEAIRSTGAGTVTTGNVGCIMQIGAGLRLAGDAVEVRHPVELLDESYRRAGFYRDGGPPPGGGGARRRRRAGDDASPEAERREREGSG